MHILVSLLITVSPAYATGGLPVRPTCAADFDVGGIDALYPELDAEFRREFTWRIDEGAFKFAGNVPTLVGTSRDQATSRLLNVQVWRIGGGPIGMSLSIHFSDRLAQERFSSRLSKLKISHAVFHQDTLKARAGDVVISWPICNVRPLGYREGVRLTLSILARLRAGQPLDVPQPLLR